MALINSDIRRYVRITLGVFSAIAGLIFLSQSSFFEMQFDDTKTSGIFVFAILSAVLVLLVFVAPSWSEMLQKVWNLNFSVKSMIDCLFLGIVWLLAFLVKYPRFDVHSKYRNSCVEEQGKKISLGNRYNLYSIGAFALLALFLSSDRQKTMELGFFTILIGLIMDISMEIPATDDAPNLWYMLGAFLYCIGLIFFRRYIESLMGNRDDNDGLKGHKKGRLRSIVRNSLELFSATVGITCLFLSPFFEQQFKDSANLKGVCFTVSALLLGFSLLKAPKFINMLEIKCHGRYLVKTMVKSFLFMIVSGVIFISKYPRFKIHSNYRESCKEENGKEILQGNQFDVYATGAFSLFSLTISSEREQPVKLGLFSFLLELTMDTSIEILGSDGPDVLYMLGAAVYCVLLILVKSYLDSSMESSDSYVGQQGSHQYQLNEIRTDPSGGEKSIGDEQPLIESQTREEKGHEITDNELTTEEIESSVAVEEDDGIMRQETDTGDEAAVGVVYGVPSHMDEESRLLNRRERHKTMRREKAKREKERKRRHKRNKNEDLWMS